MNRKTHPRGYLLMEAMIGGAILALFLTATFTLIAQARADVSYAQRRAQAGSLCREILDDLSTNSTLVAGSGATTPVDPTEYPGITYDYTITDVTATYTGFGSMAAGRTLFEIAVNVHYPTANGTKTFTEKILRLR